ncbi:MAG: serine/threonine-protein kinase [Myxococcota bacterium]
MASVPRVLGESRFTVTRMLGEGGMAEVWECYDHKLSVWRAVKFLDPKLAERKSVLRRFMSEGQALARVQHPNVVRVYDVGQSGGRTYLLLELANGGSLEGYVRKYGPMDARLAVDAMIQVCAGVQAAHDQGIIHRDIKPDNVLVDRKGVCKVTDFGIAQMNEDASYTRTGSTMGTIAFMAPEQRKDAKNVSGAVDVYSLGSTLFALLCNESPAELFMAHHHPHLLDPIPEPLRPVILGAVAFEPHERFASPADFARALVGVREALPVWRDVPPLITLSQEPGEVPEPLPSALPEDPFADVEDQETVVVNANEAAAYEDARAASPPRDAARLTNGFGNRPDSNVLPYQLPKMEKRESNPSYLDEPEPDDKEQRKQAALDALKRLEERKRVEDPELSEFIRDHSEPAPTEPFVPAVEPVAQSEPRPVAASEPESVPEEWSTAFTALVVGGPLVLVLGVVVVLVAVGVRTVGVAATLAEAADRELYTSIEAEAGLISDLEAIRADTTEVREHLQTLRASTGRDRLEAANAYIESARVQVELHAHRSPAGSEKQARHAVETVEALTDRFIRRRERATDWALASDAGLGGLVCTFGLGRCAGD